MHYLTMRSVKRIIHVIFLIVCLSDIRESVAHENYHLPRSVKSVYYKLHFKPNFETKTFEIDSNWIFNITERRITYISEHEINLKCHETPWLYSYVDWKDFQRRSVVKHRVKRTDEEPSNIVESYYEGTPELKIQTYRILRSACVGLLTNNMEGFYLDEYPDENHRSIQFLTTQFGPIGSRYAHHCSDEPYFRAKFKIIITRPNDYICITNTNLKKSTQIGNLMEDEFESTKPISPSSVAFTISKMQISPEQKGSIHRIVARPEVLKSENHKIVLTLINTAYTLIEKFLKVNCELENLYHVALPSNRMKFESLGSYWGINHYKEKVLIITNDTLGEQEETSTISIIKLLAQQWFLSYLMVDSWTWAWVNDGLTMYISYNITNQIYPEWIINERLLIETRQTMQEDSKCCCTAINKKAITPSEIKAKFNIITVYKGAALVTMMERIIPPDAFSFGLQSLIEAKKWSIYTSKNLYEEIERIIKLYNFEDTLDLPRSFTKVISVWENQRGYPLLTVRRSYDTYDLEKVSLEQEHFHTDKSAKELVWPIPINYVTMYNPNFKNTRPTSWIDQPYGQLTIKSLRKADWLILNKQATYYYRVNYDAQNWILITAALKKDHTVIHYLNRMQLIDDAFSLAEFGMLRYSTALNLCEYIKNERDYGPLKSLHDASISINKKLYGCECYEEFQIFIKTSVEYIYDQFVILSNDKMLTESSKFHRIRRTLQFLFSWLCDLQSTKCDNRSWKSTDTLHLLLSNVFDKYALSISMKNADEKEWKELFNKYKSDNNSSSKFRMATALGCCSNSSLQESFLLFVIKWQPNSLIMVVNGIIHTGIGGVNLVLKFISNIFTTLLLVYSDYDIISILNTIGSCVTTPQQLKILVQFSMKYEKYSYLIDSCIARGKENLKWRKNYMRSIDKYFRSSGTIYFNNVQAIVLIIQPFIKLTIY